MTNKTSRRFAPTLIACLALCSSIWLSVGSAPLPAQEVEPAAAPASVIVEISIHEASGDTRSYQLLTTTDGALRRLTTGSRVAIPVTTTGGPASGPVTSYQYQDVGFSAEVRVSRFEGDELRVQARLEDSLLAGEERSNRPPNVEHHTQELQAVVPLGTELEATSLGVGSRTGYRVTLELRPVR